MVTISVLALPLVVGASTTYTGDYGTIHYAAYTGDSQSKIKAELSTNSYSTLYYKMNPTVCYYQNGSWVTLVGTFVDDTAYQSKIITKYYYYTYYATAKGLPNVGYFVECYYYFAVNGHNVVSNAREIF